MAIQCLAICCNLLIFLDEMTEDENRRPAGSKDLF